MITADNVVLIGDTPSDVTAAITAGAHVVAVASGKYSIEDLRSAGATATLQTPEELPELLTRLRNHQPLLANPQRERQSHG